MNDDLMKNHQLACEGDPISRACAEKMKLSEPQNASILRVSNQNVIRVCYSSVWEIHEPVQANGPNIHALTIQIEQKNLLRDHSLKLNSRSLCRKTYLTYTLQMA